MSKPKINTDSFSIRSGHLDIVRHTLIEFGDYKTGFYIHPLGVVVIYAQANWCQIRTARNGREYIQSRQEELTDRQIGHFCRKLLLKINEP